MRYVVGVDGGGTKTTAAVVGDDLGVIGVNVAGPANSRSAGKEAASANIALAITGALRIAEVSLAQVAGVCLSIAGFDTDLDLPVLQRAIVQLNYQGVAIFENDVVGAWAGVTAGEPGVAVIAGTGATALGMNTHGDLWRVDGWDYILGDRGSGYQIGLLGIQSAMAMLDGRQPPTLLVRKLGVAFGVADAEEMRRLTDSGPFGKFQISTFARYVAEAADEGDPFAQDLLTQAGRDLGASAVAAIRELDMGADEFPIGTVGSMFKSTPWVTDPFRQAALQAAPRAYFRAPLHPPEVGAAILAQRRLDDGDHGSWTLGSGRRRIRRGPRIDDLLPITAPPTPTGKAPKPHIAPAPTPDQVAPDAEASARRRP
ncbi:MAG TPA: BadF/BadG/BcrA/BcrD ATPase family protein [Ktedonobacterales bacterium]|nr:BadF/BadG/BcrA/BcrD ATPase family protein [Ktedonobacterales bacterium]